MSTRGAWRRGAVRIAVVGMLALGSARAQETPSIQSNRVALVIGEGAYVDGPLPAAPNDAGLVAQTLAAAGFDVTGARDLDGQGLRTALGDFTARAASAGPDGIAVVYLAGLAIQFDGENYFAPVDARLGRPSDIPLQALRLTDITRALAALPIQARIVVVDGAYANGPRPGAPGLALVEAEQGELLAFNAAPGTGAPQAQGAYGTYAQTFVQAMKQGGIPVAEMFDRVRLSVQQITAGAQVPWDSDQLTRSFTFFDRAPDAPAVSSAQIPFASLQKRPIRDFPPDQAYDVAIARDTLPAYADFLTAFPGDPLARRVKLLLAVRREALFWRAAFDAGSPAGFWTYLDRYPKGPHAADARRRLQRLAAAAIPPRTFRALAIDVPPPPPGDETVVYDAPMIFAEPDLPPPPPPPIFLLPPRGDEPPPRPLPPRGPGLLPVPVPVPIPFVRAPVEPGVIVPPRVVRGEYPHPRPFARGPNGNGLVIRPAPAGAAPIPASPSPVLSPKRGAPLPVPPSGAAPGVPHLPAPVASPQTAPPPGVAAPLPVPPGPGTTPPGRHAQPARRAAPPTASTPAGAPGSPPAPTTPGGGSGPAVTPPPDRPRPGRVGVPGQASPDGAHPKPPATRRQPAPAPEPRGSETPPRPPAPQVTPRRERLPVQPANPGGADLPIPALPQPAPRPAASSPAAPPPRDENRPAAAPRPASQPHPGRPALPAQAEPGPRQLGGPPAAGGGMGTPERRHPECGHPGQPPCRP